MLKYSWYMVNPGGDIGMEIVNENNMTQTIMDPMYGQNATGYYCIASNYEGIAVSNTSTLTGNKCCVTVTRCY